MLSTLNALGELPLSLQASDKDEEGNDNSRISMTIVSQEPAWPKITLKPIGSVNDSMVTKLIVTGCFDYDVSVTRHTAFISVISTKQNLCITPLLRIHYITYGFHA